MSKPDQAKGEKKSPAAKDGNLTAQHFTVGDKITTKSGKTGVVTHIHGKAGYLFIHNAEQGKTYHVSWGSVTSIDGQNVADIPKQSATEDWKSPAGKAILEAANKPAGKQDSQPAGQASKQDGQPEVPIVASYPAQAKAWTALRSHGWKPSGKADSTGAVRFTHSKLGNTFQVDAFGTLTKLGSGTKIKPGEAAEYLDGFHADKPG